EDLRRSVHGCLRRISVNLYRVHSEAQAMCVDAIDLARWGKRGWFTGEAPTGRGR
ncbi:MAG TPA: DNA transposition protein, partial [Pseudomonas sp.]|nr:DNA transposition protein [Pseudomonas sp.]